MAIPVKPFTRWTADTQTAFLLALRLHGNVRGAAGTIGRSVTSAYKVRTRDPAFAARWAEVVVDQQAEWIAVQTPLPVVPREGRERRDGWTDARRTRFLAVLAQTGSVTGGCAAVGLSTTAARQHRGRSAKFAAAWDQALADSRPSPIEAAYARAVEGWLEPVVFQGQVVAHKRRFSDVALKLLIQIEESRRVAAAQAAAQPGRKIPEYADPEDTNRVILDQLDVIEKRRALERSNAAIKIADHMARDGTAP